MKVLVFGATGGTGSLVLKQALNQGFRVTAFVRNPQKLVISNSNLETATGDVLQPETIDAVMPGHDAVICCLGSPATKPGQLRSEGTKNIIRAMERFGVPRLICQTSLGYGDSKQVLNYTSFFFKNLVVPLLLRKTFSEHAKQEEVIRQSSLHWTIVRPGNLSDKAFTGNYKQGDNYNDSSWKVKISRADLSHFLVEQLSDPRYLRKTVGISY